MKAFLQMFVASLAAQLFLAVAGFFFLFIFIAALASAGGPKPVSTRDAVMIIDLSSPIRDRPVESDARSTVRRALSGGPEVSPLQLFTLVRAVRKATDDKDVSGLLLVGTVPREAYSSGLAALTELREALMAFRASGKPIFAYEMDLDEATYYVVSAANTLILHPFGTLVLNGLASENLFFAKTLEKLGVGVQVTRVGKYKAAVEPFLLDKMSEPNRQQLQALLDDLWKGVLGTVAEARKTTPEKLQKLADEGGLFVGGRALEAGLVDKTAYFDELLDELKVLTLSGPRERTFKQVRVQDYIQAHEDELAGTKGGKIAVIYAEGEIVNGQSREQVGGDSLGRLLRKARLDSSIEAVVLRVNSPGGSATASEVIQREVRLIKEKKPMIVSMGTVAASGGYWISAYADRIFAEPGTITGSIGVFGLLFNVENLSRNVGLSADTVKTARLADYESLMRPKSDEELGLTQKLVDDIYKQFLDRVTEGRKLERAAVEELAQGRVWSGLRGKELGLVDELGGLEAAIEHAAEAAKLGKRYQVVSFQKKQTALAQLAELLGEDMPEGDGSDSALDLGTGRSGRTGASATWLERLADEAKKLERLNDPQGIYARLPVDVFPR